MQTVAAGRVLPAAREWSVSVDEPPALLGQTISVMIVDDHRSYAEALARVFRDEADIEVLGTVSDSQAAADAVSAQRPLIVLLDYTMPGLDGATVAAEIRRRLPATRVVMLTGATDDKALLAAVSAGCAGYLSKTSGIAEIVAAVRTIAAGGSLFPGGVLARLLPRLNQPRRDAEELTERERSVLDLLAKGWANREIAEHLHLSVNTVRNYVQSILVKMGAHSKLEAVATAVRRGLVSYDGQR